MTINYTNLLGLAKPVTGTETGQWGDVVNDQITELVEDAVANASSISVTSGDVTLTTTTGSANQARMSTLIITGSPGVTRNVIAPSQAKTYVVINQSNASVVIKGAATTGVTLLASEKASVAWNGSDFVKIATQSGNGDFVTVDTTNLEVTNIKAKDGTAAASIADSTGIISITSNPILSGGTANGVLYLNGSKVATSGSAVTYNGTTFSTTADASISGLTVGKGAGSVSTNTAVGASALAANTSGAYNTALGNLALNANQSGSGNVAIGFKAGTATTNNFNTAIGGGFTGFTKAALEDNSSGAYNIGIGSGALGSNTTASNNTAVGYQSLYSQTAPATGRNTAVGYQSALSNTTGDRNTAIGTFAMNSFTTGSNNTALGEQALYGAASATGTDNVAIGKSAASGMSSGSYNVAIGASSLINNTTANYNTAVGYQAAYLNTTGYNNAAFGTQALYANTTGFYNTAIGDSSFGSNTTGSYNTAVGRTALYSNTTASYNTAVGYQASYSNTTGIGLVATGYQAGYSNTTGNSNSSYGNQALRATTTGSNNTAVGQEALALNTTASNNTAVGYQAGYNATGAGNTIMGVQAGYSLSSGTYNNLFGYASTGYGAGGLITTGSKNTIIGGFSGNQGGLDIRTTNNCVVLSDGDGNLILNAQNGASIALQGAITKAGTGITFPATQSASSDANTLDDYEEGTWTPTISRDGGAVNPTYTSQVGYYVKIGRVVYVWGTVAWSAIGATSSSSNTIGGLPFSAGTSQNNGWANFGGSSGVATNPVLAGLFYNQVLYLRKSADILAVSNINEAFSTSGSFQFNGMFNIL